MTYSFNVICIKNYCAKRTAKLPSRIPNHKNAFQMIYYKLFNLTIKLTFRKKNKNKKTGNKHTFLPWNSFALVGKCCYCYSSINCVLQMLHASCNKFLVPETKLVCMHFFTSQPYRSSI